MTGMHYFVLFLGFFVTLTFANMEEDMVSDLKTDPRVFFANYTSGLLGLFPVSEMSLSTMNVAVLLGLGALVAVNYFSSSSGSSYEEVPAYGSSSFRNFFGGDPQERSFRLMAFVNAALDIYKKLNEKEEEE